MTEKHVQVPLPTGGTITGVEVTVDESTERWSDFKLMDGTVLRAKISIVSAIRLEGQYDPQGNPSYSLNLSPLVAVVSSDQKFKKRVQ